jgi:nitrogen fixation protein NifU and related proteins
VSGSLLTEMIEAKPIAACLELTVEDLIKALDDVPPERLHCQALAIEAIEGALRKWPRPD